MAGAGLRDKDISLIKGIPERTIRRRCAADLQRGRAIALATVASTLYRMATSGKSVAATIFYLKVRGGWREKDAAAPAGPTDGPQVVELPANGRGP